MRMLPRGTDTTVRQQEVKMLEGGPSTLHKTRGHQLDAMERVRDLQARIDVLAPVVRASLVNDSDLRLAKFEESIRDNASREGDLKSHRAAYSLKRFIVRRHQHVRAQLEGKESGVIFRTRERPGRK
jgi:hypothetical protein